MQLKDQAAIVTGGAQGIGLATARRLAASGAQVMLWDIDEGALAAEQLGLLLIPALACDATGIRLGYGGGWYDRLRADPTWAQVPALAVLPRGCRVERLPRDPWDVPLQGWIDEDGLGHSSCGNPSCGNPS